MFRLLTHICNFPYTPSERVLVPSSISAKLESVGIRASCSLLLRVSSIPLSHGRVIFLSPDFRLHLTRLFAIRCDPDAGGPRPFLPQLSRVKYLRSPGPGQDLSRDYTGNAGDQKFVVEPEKGKTTAGERGRRIRSEERMVVERSLPARRGLEAGKRPRCLQQRNRFVIDRSVCSRL